MDDEDMNDPMQDLLAHSLEGNALSVQDAVNSILSQKALDALAAMKVDVAQSIYGNYGSEDQEVDMDMSVAEEPEDLPEDEPEEESTEWEVPEDEDAGLDSDLEDLFGELEDLTDQDDTEQPDNEEDDSDE